MHGFWRQEGQKRTVSASFGAILVHG
jgi:hypothetical protein